ncbi:esterase [Poriferisphaera corsica]|uniref:Esterase n=1 Tax=Poriferisphaera corsica TaxID=2528020 RepID=A0A517YYF0_9BACT|nr:alpha/beta fold hydrolase [Poriferisphaera corsica]QDU35251.1 esterase [Poriferisphaera corsica]
MRIPTRRFGFAILFLLLSIFTLPGCLQGIIADQVLKAPNPTASNFTIKVKANEDISRDIPFLFDAANVLPVGRGKHAALMTYFVVEPKPNFYYVHSDFSLHDDKPWEKAVRDAEPMPIATHNRTISADYLPYQLCITISHPAVNETTLRQKYIAKPRGTIILLQGHSGYTRKEPYLWPLAAVLSNQGYRVIMPDLRGQGDSTGEQITFGKLETHDLKQLVDDLQDRNLLSGNLGIMGHSYGSMMSIFAGANDPRIKAIASISPNNFMADTTAPMNIAKIFHPELYATLQSLGGNNLVEDGLREAASRLRVNPDTFSPSTAITKTQTPLLLLHGTSDQICPSYASEQIQTARPKNTTRITFPGDDHWSLLYKQATWQSIVNFFDTNLNPAAAPRTNAIAGLHYQPMSHQVSMH